MLFAGRRFAIGSDGYGFARKHEAISSFLVRNMVFHSSHMGIKAKGAAAVWARPDITYIANLNLCLVYFGQKG